MQELKFLNYTQASEFLGIPKGTLYSLVHYKKIPHYRYGDRFIRFEREELERWVKEHQVGEDDE